MNRRPLPIGIQNFRKLRQKDAYYVDKTPLIRRLVDDGDYYFLSRPRRFGKSLLISTLKSLFECDEELFRGLDIHDKWDWSKPHPVVRLSFGGKYSAADDLEGSILTQLTHAEQAAGLELTNVPNTGPERLQNLLFHLHRSTERGVVVLVDEYDKPILDLLKNTERAEANRDYLRGFYGIIKDMDEQVHFVFVTGVSMFSKVSLFSGLNNLEDISLNPDYGTICGYTEEEVDRVFAPELSGLDRDKIRSWYNGYNWLGDERVYNPFDLLLLFRSRRFQPHWFRTGSTKFLFDKLMEASITPMDLENRMTDIELVSKFDVEDIEIEALMFQTGYLTIAEELGDEDDDLFRLDYPNVEVQRSLSRGLLEYLGKRSVVARREGRGLRECLKANDFPGFADRLRAYLSGIPYQLHASGDLARYEAWYASLLYMCFRTIGVDIRVEESSSRGRADMVVLSGGQVFVLEFKMADGDDAAAPALDAALAQMHERGYAEKYRDRGEPIHLIGVACGREARNILDIRVESA